MTVAIKAENLSKVYKVYPRPADMLYEFITRRQRHTEFWALRDVSFELRKGEMVAFVGRNGAGKSTLLKIIAGTLAQNEGSYEVNGRVASILELGTGFNPEYTGRENVELGGLCLGLSKQEIAGKMDWIIEFSELEEFIDRPFKTYSSGMQARLTFATASCIEPEVLIVDEALAVGDVKFQVKCFDRLRQFRERGGTILLVSHDLNTINTFCDRVYYLQSGEVVAHGEPKDITTMFYNDLFNEMTPQAQLVTEQQMLRQDCFTSEMQILAKPELELVEKALERPISVGDGRLRIVDYGCCTMDGDTPSLLIPNEEYVFYMRLYATEDTSGYRVGLSMRDAKGQFLWGSGTHTMGEECPPLEQGEIRDFYFLLCPPFVNLPILVSMATAASETHIFEQLKDCLVLQFENRKELYPDSFVLMKPDLMMGNSWTVDRDGD